MNSDPQSLLGRYKLVKVLGRGAMGVVYEATDTRLSRTVAVKTVQRGFLADESTAADYTARFEREAQAAARLNHPHIVAVFDFGEQIHPLLSHVIKTLLMYTPDGRGNSVRTAIARYVQASPFTTQLHIINHGSGLAKPGGDSFARRLGGDAKRKQDTRVLFS